MANLGGEAVAARLDPLVGPPQAQLDGYKSRTMRAQPPTPRNLYLTEWIAVDALELSSSTVVMVGGNEAAMVRNRTAAVLAAADYAFVVALATPRASFALLSLCALELALTLVQSQAGTTAAPKVWLLTTGVYGGSGTSASSHAGAWGLARSARAEASVPLFCTDAPMRLALTRGPPLPEPEAVLHEHAACVPRLQTAPQWIDGLVRVHLHSRGAVSNLFIEPLPALPPLGDAEVLLRVRSVGLNFRDVLNVLGEYPGDPGPPGGDVAGTLDDASSPQRAVFGLAQAPLACVAITAMPLISRKPATLAFEQACTLPVTWCTTHTALERAGLRARLSVIVQAAAGGVGLKAVEYSHLLCAPTLGTAGRPHKHLPLHEVGVGALCSSRDGAAFAGGMGRLLTAGRSHAALNSLSLDFIAVSFAGLRETGAFGEIGKRSIWSPAHHRASAHAAQFFPIALDADLAHDPFWFHGVLTLLAARAGGGAATSLPLQSFDIEAQHELAFRTLLGGLNTGKIVVCFRDRQAAGSEGGHVVTGGTGGLGLLTGRWLAQRGASHLVLASRSGALASDAAAELDAVQASGTASSIERCDIGESTHVRRLLAFAPSFAGVWHAAGVLADAVLPKQDALSLSRVYASKVHGAWCLHAMTVATAVHAFAVFSSVAALFGGAGQANYAAANACLDALAAYRCARGATASSMQWAAWAEMGMAARGAAGERMAAMEAASGPVRISLVQGLAALGTAVRQDTPSVLCVLPVSPSKMLTGGAEVPPLLSAFAPKSKETGVVGRRVAAGACGGASEGCGVSLEEVLEMVQRTAGGSVDADAPLMEAGVDSLGAIELRNKLQVAGGAALPSTVVFDHPTSRQLASVLQPKQAASASLASVADVEAPRGASVGIEGMSGLLPSGASSPLMVSRLVACGCNAIMEVPVSRWDVHEAPTLPEPMASRVRHTGFVRGAELADNKAFAVSPAEAAAMDPCQRLVLEHGYAALHSAKLDRVALSGSLTGVFLGFTGTELYVIAM